VEISSLDASQSAYAVFQQQQPPSGSQTPPGLQTLATDLGVSTSDLQTARASGESLSDFATSKGISQDTLLAAVKDSITTNAPAGATPLSSDQLNAMATDMVNRKPGGGGGHHHHHGGGASSVQMPDSSLLSALTGTPPTDSTSSTDTTLTQLLQQLTSSQSSTTGDSTGTSSTSLQQLLQQLTDSSSSTYGSDGTTPDLTGSIGLNAFA
jgi:hypothetical protein